MLGLEAGDDHSHLPVADPWFQPRRRAVILCPLPPDQSLGEPVDPPSMATSFAATKPDSAAGMVPSANAEQFAYPRWRADRELGRVIAEQRAERDRPDHQRLDSGRYRPDAAAPVHADYSSVLVRPRAGIRGGYRRGGHACGCEVG